MISRESVAREFLLRENIQKAISIIQTKKVNARKLEILNEIKLRTIIQDLIIEAAVDPDEDPSSSTGINVLADLIKNSNFLKTIRTGYKILTTSDEQRASYRAHIVNAIQDALAPVMANQRAGEEVNESDIIVDEDIEVDISDEDKFIEGEPDSDEAISASEEPEEEEPVDPKEDFGIEGQDETGRDRAFKDFRNIEQTIIDHFEMLSNSDDREKFYDYLITNTKLYFDRYEKQLQASVEEPTNQEYDAAVSSQGGEEAAPEPAPGADSQLGSEEPLI